MTAICSAGLPYHAHRQGRQRRSVTTPDEGTVTSALINYGLYRDAGHTQNWGVTD